MELPHPGQTLLESMVYLKLFEAMIMQLKRSRCFEITILRNNVDEFMNKLCIMKASRLSNFSPNDFNPYQTDPSQREWKLQ